MAFHPAEDKYVTRVEGPFGVGRACKLCKFQVFRKKVPGMGRGAGMREGNKQRGILIQHIKDAHPAEYAEAMGKTHNAFSSAENAE